MAADASAPTALGLPAFLGRADELRRWVCGLSYAEQKALWRCSDAIARQSAEQFAHMDLRSGVTPALLAYVGIQYTYMAPTVFDEGQLAYVQEHLRILAGFYGVLRPMDGVVPYRLEMQAKVRCDGCANLYEFWGDALYREILDGSRVIVNLASKEYSRAFERYLVPEDRCVSCVFGELEGGRVRQKGVYAKMARGEMVRYLANVGAEEPEAMREFAWSGYAYDKGRSTATEYVFVRSEVPRGA